MNIYQKQRGLYNNKNIKPDQDLKKKIFTSKQSPIVKDGPPMKLPLIKYIIPTIILQIATLRSTDH